MRNFFVFVLLVAVAGFFAAPALAQETQRYEAFGGYEYLHLNPGGTGCHGFGANLAYNFNNWLGGVGDFGVCKETGLPAGSPGVHDVNYLFGPRVSYRNYGRLTPFAQVLFGGQHEAGGNLAFDSFAMTLGGGADYRFNEHISFRGQADYLYTHFGGARQNNARIEAGLVYRWGTR